MGLTSEFEVLYALCALNACALTACVLQPSPCPTPHSAPHASSLAASRYATWLLADVAEINATGAERMVRSLAALQVGDVVLFLPLVLLERGWLYKLSCGHCRHQKHELCTTITHTITTVTQH